MVVLFYVLVFMRYMTTVFEDDRVLINNLLPNQLFFLFEVVEKHKSICVHTHTAWAACGPNLGPIYY